MFKKKKKNKKFYNTGIKLSYSFFDRIKLKIRLADFDDTYGVRYNYLFSIKIFSLEMTRTKYTDQKGKVYKRKINYKG